MYAVVMAALFCLACGSGGGGGHDEKPPHPRAPDLSYLRGASRPNDWHLPSAEFPTIESFVCEGLAARGMNATGIEYNPVFQPDDGICPNPHGGRPGLHTYPVELAALIDAARLCNVKVVINIANMNRCVLKDHAPDSWIENAVGEIVAAAAGRWDDIYVSPVAEPHDNHPEKSRRWFNLAEHRLRAAGAVNIVAPAGWCGPQYALCDYHPQGDRQMLELLERGAHDKQLLVNTDGTGTFELSPDRVKPAIERSVRGQAHYLLYMWRFRGPFLPTLDSMAEVIAGASREEG